MKTARY